MRWEQLFEDLTGQAGAADAVQRDADAVEHARSAAGQLDLLARLTEQTHDPVEVVLLDGFRIEGTVVEHGDGWLLLAARVGSVLVPAHVLASARTSVGSASMGAAPAVRTSLGWRTVLRGLVRRRCYVWLGAAGCGDLGGTIDAVGADFLELAVHEPDRPRRDADVRAVVLVSFAAVRWLRYARS